MHSVSKFKIHRSWSRESSALQTVPLKHLVSPVNFLFVQSNENPLHLNSALTTGVHLHFQCCWESRFLRGRFQSWGAEQGRPAVGLCEANGSCAWCGHPASPATSRTKAQCSSFSCSEGGPCLCYYTFEKKSVILWHSSEQNDCWK